jgi:hypothetical protein
MRVNKQARDEGARAAHYILAALLIFGLPCSALAHGACLASVHRLSAEQLNSRCAIEDEGACTLVDSGGVKGSSRFGALHYQLMEFEDDDHDLTAAVVFSADSAGHLRPIICSELPAAYYEHADRPQVIKSSYGALLVLPPIEQGDGGPHGALLYQWRDEHWRAVDLDTWQKNFADRIAPAYHSWNGISYDFSHMTGESFLYSPQDAHVAPSGFARMAFSIKDGALELTSLTVGSSEPIFEAMCRSNPKCHLG